LLVPTISATASCADPRRNGQAQFWVAVYITKWLLCTKMVNQHNTAST